LKDQSFPKAYRILRRDDFKRVYAQGKKVVGCYLILHILPNSLGHPRLGVTVTKKSGKAVVRNRWKRLVREAFRRNKALFPSADLVVTVKRGVVMPAYGDLEEDLLKLAKRL